MRLAELQASSPLGPYVHWAGADSDVPAGAVGLVVASDNGRFCVKFHGGAYMLRPEEISPASVKWGDLPHDSFDAWHHESYALASQDREAWVGLVHAL